MHFAVVSHGHSCLIVSKNLILLNLRETGAWHDDTTTLVLMNLIVWNVIWAVKDDDAITIIIDVVMLDPTEAGLDGEDALWTRLVNQVIQDHCVCGIVAAVSNICLVILKDVILFYVSRCCVNQKNTLTEIAKYLVV